MEKAYRYDFRQYVSQDEYGKTSYSRSEIVLSEYNITKYTAKGFWIEWGDLLSFKRFVLICKKQYAFRTKFEALNSLLRRRQKYKSILESRLRVVEESIQMVLNEIAAQQQSVRGSEE